MTNQLVPCGYLRTQGEKYFLIHLSPLDPEWKGIEGKSFLAVPDDRDKPTGESVNVGTPDSPEFKHVFPCPRLVVATNYSVEYAVSIPPIECRNPEDVLDTLFEELVDKQGALS